jgi:hypothetical protein
MTNTHRASRVEILVHAKAPNTEWHDAYYSSLATAYIDFEASRRRELDGAGDEEAKFYEVSEERIPPSFERLRSAEVHDPLVAAHFPLVGGLEDQLLESHRPNTRATEQSESGRRTAHEKTAGLTPDGSSDTRFASFGGEESKNITTYMSSTTRGTHAYRAEHG